MRYREGPLYIGMSHCWIDLAAQRALHIRKLILVMTVLPSWPDHRPNVTLLFSIILTLRFQWECWGTKTCNENSIGIGFSFFHFVIVLQTMRFNDSVFALYSFQVISR